MGQRERDKTRGEDTLRPGRTASQAAPRRLAHTGVLAQFQLWRNPPVSILSTPRARGTHHDCFLRLRSGIIAVTLGYRCTHSPHSPYSPPRTHGLTVTITLKAGSGRGWHGSMPNHISVSAVSAVPLVGTVSPTTCLSPLPPCEKREEGYCRYQPGLAWHDVL